MMQELINRVVQNVGLDPALAEKAVGMILPSCRRKRRKRRPRLLRPCRVRPNSRQPMRLPKAAAA